MSGSDSLVLVTHEYLPKKGGIAVYCHELALAACACNYQVEVWAPGAAVERLKQDEPLPFSIASLPNRGTHGPLSVLSTARVLRRMEERLSGAHVCLVEPGPIYAAMWLEYLKGITAKHLSLVLHGSEILKIGSNARRKRLFQSLLGRVDKVGVVSEHNKRKACELLGVPEAKLVLVPGAVRHELTGEDEAFAGEQSCSDGDRLVLLTLARVHPRKGQHAVLEALKRLPDAVREKVEYVVAGPVVDGAYQRELEALAGSCGVPVRFLGELPDAALVQHLRRCDIFIMTPQPYKQSVEGFGMVYLEAGACGVPAIAHDIGGVSDAVRDGKTGLLVKPGDADALAQAIVKLVEDESLRRQMGAAARERALEHSWKDNVRLLLGK